MMQFARAVGCAFGLIAVSAQRMLAQTLPLPYWQHSEWTGDNAPPIGGGNDLARSADGYLWMGATNAMIRFDGIRFTVMDSTNTPAFRGLQRGRFFSLVLDRRGALWLHGPGGSMFTYADGVVRAVFSQESGATGDIAEDGAGRLWTTSDGSIRLIENGQLVVPHLPAGTPDSAIFGLARDTSDGLWIGTERDGLWHVQGNRVDRFGTGRVRALLQSRDGITWVIGEGLGSGLWKLVAGQLTEVHIPSEPSRPILTRVAREGANGSVWFVTVDMGVLRWHNGHMERFSKDDGLSVNHVRDVYADEEDAVWALTDAGLDRLRPSTFARIESHNGLPISAAGLFAEDTSGAIWLSAPESIYLLDGGIIRNGRDAVTSRLVARHNSYDQLISPSRFGGVWFGPGDGGIRRLDARGSPAIRANNAFPEIRIVVAFESRDGTIWTRSRIGDVGKFEQGKYKPLWISAADKPVPHGIAEDGFGRTWFASAQNRVTVLAGDSIVSQFVLPAGGGRVFSLVNETGDTMWVSTQSTLIRIIGQRAVEVAPPGLKRVMTGGTQLAVSRGSLWLASPGGFARIPLNELHRAADGGAAVPTVEVFGPLDGLTVAHAATQLPIPIRVHRDGRVWVATPNGLAVADPSFRMDTKHPRKVIIEEFSVGEKAVPVRNGEKIASLPSRISFRFTTPTTLLAERVRMQYRLDGADDAWIDATVPRVATYNQLRAGHYVFRVRAWDETGKQIPGEETLSFRVLPTWYQSWWFILAISVLFAGILFMLYRLRVRQLTHAYNVRLEERSAERTRIARELHDTLLQNFQGLMFRFQAVREMLPAQAHEAISVLDTALLKGEGAIDQARSAVSDLRASENVERDFDAGLAALASETIQLCTHGKAPSWTLDTKGRIREIPPAVLYELYKMVQETLGNICQHARAENVTMKVRYSIDSLRIVITDDGVGFDEALLESARRPGHFGVQGIMERVERLGGEMTLRSRPGEGTRVALSVPSNVAYQKFSRDSGIGTRVQSRSRRNDNE